MSALALIVDDEPGILQTLSGVLADQGYRTVTTSSGIEALRLYGSEHPDVVFLDVWLPDRDGLETLAAIRSQDPAATVGLMSGHGTTSTAVKAIKMGAFDYLEKPLSYAQAVDTIAENVGQDAREKILSRESPLTAKEVHRVAAMESEKQKPIIDMVLSGQAKNVMDAHRLLRQEAAREAPPLEGKYRVMSNSIVDAFRSVPGASSRWAVPRCGSTGIT